MEFLIELLPIITIVWFVYSIIQFCKTNKENIYKRKSLKKQIIVSGIINVAWIIIIVVFLYLITVVYR
ncbi:hypothetical protein TRBR_27830 [Treponema bryantii]|nr:hypothetical protein TRBR_27830 [Treponema bryantii]